MLPYTTTVSNMDKLVIKYDEDYVISGLPLSA